MNKNTKSARALLAKEKQTITVTVPMKISGNRGSGYNTRVWTLNFGHQARLSKKPKVGGDKK